MQIKGPDVHVFPYAIIPVIGQIWKGLGDKVWTFVGVNKPRFISSRGTTDSLHHWVSRLLVLLISPRVQLERKFWVMSTCERYMLLCSLIMASKAQLRPRAGEKESVPVSHVTHIFCFGAFQPPIVSSTCGEPCWHWSSEQQKERFTFPIEVPTSHKIMQRSVQTLVRCCQNKWFCGQSSSVNIEEGGAVRIEVCIYESEAAPRLLLSIAQWGKCN